MKKTSIFNYMVIDSRYGHGKRRTYSERIIRKLV